MSGSGRAAAGPARAFILALLVLAPLLVFGQALRFGFVTVDDPVHVYENPYVLKPSLAGIGQLWRAPYKGLYMPLTYTAWAGLSWLGHLAGGGLGPSPALFHGANLCLHILSVLLVFSILRRLAGSDAAACAGALLFALHPVQAESIAWVSEFKGQLSGCLCLAAILLRPWPGEWTDRRPALAWCAATTAYALALLAKPAAAALPLMLVPLDRWCLGRSWRQCLAWALPWLALVLPVLLLSKEGQPDMGIPDAPSMAGRIAVALDALAFYLRALVLPTDLVFDYGRTPRAVLNGPWWRTVIVAPALMALALGLGKRAGRVPAALLAVFFLGFAPVLGLVPFLYQKMSTVADRYMHLPLLAAALGLAWLLARRGGRGLWGAAAGLLLVLAVGSALQTGIWRDSQTLFGRTLQVNPKSFTSLSGQGTIQARAGRLDIAEARFRHALALNPDYIFARGNLGLMLAMTNRPAEAEAEFRRCVELRPASAEYRNALAGALLGQGRFIEAGASAGEALALRPGYADAYVNLGYAQLGTGRVDEAEAAFKRALELNPGLVQARQGLERARLSAVEDSVAAPGD